jgi:pyruvate ferredoxin oxidoreductase alpha subunit
MVCLDGYVLSHTEEIVDVPVQEDADHFLPPYRPEYAVDTGRPYVFGAGAGPDLYPAFKYYQQQGLLQAKEVITAVDREFGTIFDRTYGGLVDPYFCDDAEVILVLMGATAGTAREVVDDLRGQGERVGLLRLRSFRPFPVEDLQAHLAGVGVVAVLDRDCSFGYEGVLATEVKAALYGPPAPLASGSGEGLERLPGQVRSSGVTGDCGGPEVPTDRPLRIGFTDNPASRPGQPLVAGFVGGLGGRDIDRGELTGIYRRCLEALRQQGRGGELVVSGSWQK